MSVGINLSPNCACNFNCVYCQVDRSQKPRAERVDLERLRKELDEMLGWVADRSLFDHPQFSTLDDVLKRPNDIAFSGDGEPTLCPVFYEAVEMAAELKKKHSLYDTKIVLITDASCLNRPRVMEALDIMDDNQGEIWAKLDAGSEERFQLINRANVSLKHIMANLVDTAVRRPITIQTLWMRLNGEAPRETDVLDLLRRFEEILAAGGAIQCVQVYTVARIPTEQYVAPLTSDELARIADMIQSETGLKTEIFA